MRTSVGGPRYYVRGCALEVYVYILIVLEFEPIYAPF